MRIAILFLFFCACTNGVDQQKITKPKPQPPNRKFFVAGHAYGSPMKPSTGTFFEPLDAFLDQNISQYEFGVFTGDVVIHPDSLHWSKVSQKLKNYNKKFFWAPGNHDLAAGLYCQLAFPKFWEVEMKDSILLASLSTIHKKWTLSSEQLSLLDSTVKTNKNGIKRAFLFVHNVMWFDSSLMEAHPNSFAEYPGNEDFWENLVPEFQQWDFPVYIIAGDVGAVWDRPAYSYYKYQNLHLITSGMGESKESNVLEVEIDKGIEGMNLIFLLSGMKKPLAAYKIELETIPTHAP